MNAEQKASAEAEVRAGLEAESVVRNPAYQRAMIAVKSRIYEEWSAETSPKARDRLWIKHQIALDFEQEFSLMISGKALATASLEMEA